MTTDERIDVTELSAAQVNKLLVRGHGWAEAHVVELGGYCTREPGQKKKRYRFPIHAIRAWQERQAEEFARS